METPLVTAGPLEAGLIHERSRSCLGLHSLALHPAGLDDAGIERVLADPPLGILVSHAVGESEWGPPVMARLSHEGVPLVVNGDRAGFAGYDRVVSDHEAGARELTDWLIARGRRKILRVWTADPGSYWMKARDKGHERACREAGIEPLPAVCVKGFFKKPEPGRDTFEVQTRQFAGYLVDHLGPKGSVDAVMATTDPEVFPIAAACRLLGRRPNQDVELVGYDCSWAACPEREWEPAGPLATVDKLNHGTGEEMVKLLLDRVQGKLPASSGDGPQRVSVRPELVVVGQGDEHGSSGASRTASRR